MGGAGDRDRTDDIQLGKLCCSQADQRPSCKTRPFGPQQHQRLRSRTQNETAAPTGIGSGGKGVWFVEPRAGCSRRASRASLRLVGAFSDEGYLIGWVTLGEA